MNDKRDTDGYSHPLCRDLRVLTADTVIEDLVVREESARPEKSPVERVVEKREKEEKLSSYMTHELRAPLTSIRSALGLLDMELANRLSDQEAQTLEMAVRNAERLNGLIDDIMDFAKIRDGKMRMNLESCRPEELMQEAIDSLRSWALQKGVRVVRVENDEPLPRVTADRRRTVQVLTNLLSNALKFTPAGKKVELTATLGKHGHFGTVQFRVKDQGPGIPHEDLERVFACFEQSAQGVKASQGTGLGLTLAKAMIEAQSGRIWAESWKGLGAELFFTLPIAAGQTTKPVKVYPEPVEYHGLLMGAFKRLNAVVAALVG
jgi:signal transduction histidine kinase